MTFIEFAEIIAFLESAMGRSIGATEADGIKRTEVYFAMLGDLPRDALRAAAEQAAATFKPEYGIFFPPIALLRRLATAIVSGDSYPPLFDEVWQAVVITAKKLSYVTDHNYIIVRNGEQMSPNEFNDRLLAKLPPFAELAMRRSEFSQLKKTRFVERSFAACTKKSLSESNKGVYCHQH